MRPLHLPLFGTLLLASATAPAQVAPAATGPLGLSAFGGLSGTFTGLYGGKNLGLTGGGDLELPPIWKLRPYAEVRGNYPIHEGSHVGEKNIYGGLRENFRGGPLNRVHIIPFADVLFGWGRLAYPHGGIPSLDGSYQYFHTTSFTWAPGAGGELRLTPRWGVRGDLQLEHYSTPVTTSGDIWSKALTASVVYRFDRYHTHMPWSPTR